MLLLLFSFICYGIASVEGQDDYMMAQLTEAPRIRCGDSSVKVTLLSSEPFEGNVYAKGFFSKDECRVHGDGSGSMVNISIPITSDCGIRRRRTVNPKGIVLEMTLVLMFHQKLLTRNDKAFHIECMYMEVSHRITNRLEVSMLPSTETRDDELTIRSKANVPSCKYEVLNEKNQKLLYATIGQNVFHRWYCQPNTESVEDSVENANLYCLTVHSCEVDDGHGNVQRLLDRNGCPIDKHLLGKINYTSDLEANRKGFVFKFADKPTVYFSCQLRLEIKNDFSDECLRTSDNCERYASGEAVVGHVVGYEPKFPTPEPTVTPSMPLTNYDATSVEISGYSTDSSFGTSNGASSSSPSFSSSSFFSTSTPSTIPFVPNDSEENYENNNSMSLERSKYHIEPSSVEVEPSTRTRETIDLEFSNDVTPKYLNDVSKQSLDTRLSSETVFDSLEAQMKLKMSDEQSTTPPKMFGNPSLELDVNAPGVDVIDVVEASHDAEPVHIQKSAPIDVNEFSQNQVCMSRKVASYTVLFSVSALTLIILLVGTLLIRAIHKQRIATRTNSIRRFNDSLSDHRVLSAYSA